MGTSISKNLELTTNEYLQKFVSNEKISQNDPFWNRFVAFNISPPMTSNDQLAFESRIEGLCNELLRNNLKSGNFGTIIDIFISRSSELLVAINTEASLFSWQLFNILFIIRCILKYLIDIVTEEQLIQHIEYGGGDGGSSSSNNNNNNNSNGNSHSTRLELFISSLFGIIVDIPVIEQTYGIHLESITILLILLSIQLHNDNDKKSDRSNIYHSIMRGRHVIHAPLLIKHLLINYMEQKKPPIGGYYGSNYNSGHSFVLDIASEIWSILTFNRKSSSSSSSSSSMDNNLLINDTTNEYQHTPLAIHSLLLILVLVHHWTIKINPYRISLFSCRNIIDNNNQIQPTQAPSLFKIDFNQLYTTICKKATNDTTTLLLYLLLHRNESFKSFLLKRVDLEQLIIPILKTLYNAPNSNSHHIYMSLIILLILSEDESFNRVIHETKLRNVVWYTERVLNEVSLGGLLILIVIRTVQYNMLKMRDKYLHTNCLAALANMSAQFRELHPYVSQRLISLFETLARRYQKLSTKLINGGGGGGSSSSNCSNKDHIELSITTTTTTTTQIDNDMMEQDINVLEEVLRMILEILNSCLSNQLINNPNLVYTLLYKKHIFETFKENSAFEDIIYNIGIIIKYFSDLLIDRTQQYEVDSIQVLNVIQQGAKHWPKDKIKKFPDLKFKYVEEDQPEEFFIPYVWSLVTQQSILHWTNDNEHVVITSVS